VNEPTAADVAPHPPAKPDHLTEKPDTIDAGAEVATPPGSDAPGEPVDHDPENDVTTWLQRAREKREAGQTTEARDVLETAALRFPEAAAVHQELARMAEAGRDWAAAEQSWHRVAALNANDSWVIGQLAHLMRLQGRLADADALVADALERFPNDAALFIDHARMAETRRDWPQAEARWTYVAGRFPDTWEGLTGQAKALREQGNPQRARALLEPIADRFPTATPLIDELARAAQATRDWPAAERWWRQSMVLDPAPWWSTLGLINALNEQGRTAEAEAILLEQAEHMPHESWRFIEHTRLAERAGDWKEAAKRWSTVQERFPNVWESYVGLARALRELGNPDEAQAVLLGALTRFPEQTGPLEGLALLAQHRRDWPEAEQRWRSFLRLNAQVWQAYTWLAITLREQQRISEATDVLLTAAERFVQTPDALTEIVDQLSRPGGSIAVRYLEKFVDTVGTHAGQTAAKNAVLFAGALIARERNDREEYRRLLTELAEKLPGDWRINALLNDTNALAMTPEPSASDAA
jgi:tetratricopeptide (TPR) repeat protein